MRERSPSVVWLVCLVLASVACGRTHVVPPLPFDAAMDSPTMQDAQPDVVRESGADEDAHVITPRPPRPARNVIVFMGDGMGPEQLATGRVAAGGRLRLDVMAGPALAETDSLTTLRVGGNDPPATDSAASATAIATGVLVENGVVSQAVDGTPMETVLEKYKREGKAVGVVTTSTFFDASPAAFASHESGRGRYREIARDMIADTQLDVIMGSGAFLLDDTNNGLAEMADQLGYVVVRNASQLAAWDPVSQPRLIGLFATDFRPVAMASEPFTMTPELERTGASSDPTLAVMTSRAIERLAADEQGFFLFVEDEIFDQMGHRGPAEVAWANRAYPQQVAGFDAAVSVAIEWVLAHSSFDETLIVVLADHETGGYRFDHNVGPESGEFTAFTDNGSFRYGYHTRTPIEVYALGAGADAIDGVREHRDTFRLLCGNLP